MGTGREKTHETLLVICYSGNLGSTGTCSVVAMTAPSPDAKPAGEWLTKLPSAVLRDIAGGQTDSSRVKPLQEDEETALVGGRHGVDVPDP